jgi:hypothetical protein
LPAQQQAVTQHGKAGKQPEDGERIEPQVADEHRDQREDGAQQHDFPCRGEGRQPVVLQLGLHSRRLGAKCGWEGLSRGHQLL